MGVTQVQAKVFGEAETREYTFLVDTRANFMALPMEEIEGLGLKNTLGKVKLMGATGVVEVSTYLFDGELAGRWFGGLVVPASKPVIGHGLLENRGFRINPATQEVEPFPDDMVHPPYLL